VAHQATRTDRRFYRFPHLMPIEVDMKRCLALLLTVSVLPVVAYSQSLTVPNIGNIVYVDGAAYPRTDAGIRSAIAALGATVGGHGGTVVLTPGVYTLCSGANPDIIVNHDRVRVIGSGEWTTQLNCSSNSNVVVFQFKSASASAIINQNEFGNVAFSGGGSGQKIAIQCVDCRFPHFHDIASLGWTGNGGSGSTPSVLIDTQGRDLGTIERIAANADRPFQFEANPNLPDSNEDLDHWHFQDIYAVPSRSEACYFVSSGTVPSDALFDGFQSCTGGKNGFYWAETGAVSMSAYSITIANLRCEQAGTSGGYCVNISRNSGSGQVQNLILQNVFDGGVGGIGGIFLTNTVNAVLVSPYYGNSVVLGTGINANRTNSGLTVINQFLVSPATNNIAGGVLANLISEGTISLSSATSASHAFTTAYGSAPICTLTPTSDPTTLGAYWATATATAVTANIHMSGSITFYFHCASSIN
jgi:hypothetical protein